MWNAFVKATEQAQQLADQGLSSATQLLEQLDQMGEAEEDEAHSQEEDENSPKCDEQEDIVNQKDIIDADKTPVVRGADNLDITQQTAPISVRKLGDITSRSSSAIDKVEVTERPVDRANTGSVGHEQTTKPASLDETSVVVSVDQSDVEALQRENKKLAAWKKKYSAERRSLLDKAAEKDDIIMNLTNDIDQINRINSEKVVAAAEEREQWAQRVKTLQQRIETLVSDRDSEIAVWKSTHDELRQKLIEQSQEYSNFKEYAEQLEANKADLMTQLIDLSAKLRKAESVSHEFSASGVDKERIRQLETEVLRLQQELSAQSEILAQCDELTRSHEVLRSNNSQLQQALDETKQQLQAESEALQLLRQSFSELEIMITDKDRQLLQLSNELAELNAMQSQALSDVQSQLQKLQAERDVLVQSNDTLQGKFQAAEKAVHLLRYRQEIEEMKQSKESLRQEVSQALDGFSQQFTFLISSLQTNAPVDATKIEHNTIDDLSLGGESMKESVVDNNKMVSEATVKIAKSGKKGKKKASNAASAAMNNNRDAVDVPGLRDDQTKDLAADDASTTAQSAEISRECETLNATNRQLQADLNLATSQLELLQARLETEFTEKSMLQTNAQQLQLDMETLQSELSSLNAAQRNFAADTDELRRKLESTELALIQSQTESQSLTEQLRDELKREQQRAAEVLTDSSQQQATFDHEVSTYQHEIKQLSHQLSALSNEQEKQFMQRDHLSSELEILVNQQQRWHDTETTMIERIATLEAQLQSTEASDALHRQLALVSDELQREMALKVEFEELLAAKTQQLHQCGQKVANLSDALAATERELTETSTALSNRDQTMQDLHTKCEELQCELTDSQQKVQELSLNSNTLAEDQSNRLTLALSNIEDLNGKLTALQIELSESQQHLQQFQAERDAANSTKTKLQTLFDDALEQRNQLQQELATITANHAQLQSNFDDFRTEKTIENADLRNELKLLAQQQQAMQQTHTNELGSIHTQHQNELSRNHDSLQAMATEKQTLQQQFHELSDNKSTLLDEVAVLIATIRGLEVDVQAKADEIQQLQLNVDHAHSSSSDKVIMLEQALQAVEAKKKKDFEIFRKQNERISALQHEANECKFKWKQAEDRCAETEHRSNQLQLQITQLEESSSQLAHELDVCKKQLQSNASANDNNSEDSQNSYLVVEKSNPTDSPPTSSTADTAKAQKERSKDETSKLAAANADLKAKVEELVEEVSIQRAHSQQLEHEMKTLQEENEALRRDATAVEDDSISQKYNKILSQYQDALSKSKLTAQHIMELEDEIDKLKTAASNEEEAKSAIFASKQRQRTELLDIESNLDVADVDSSNKKDYHSIHPLFTKVWNTMRNYCPGLLSLVGERPPRYSHEMVWIYTLLLHLLAAYYLLYFHCEECSSLPSKLIDLHTNNN